MLCSTHSSATRSVRGLGQCRGCPGYLLPVGPSSRAGEGRGQGRGRASLLVLFRSLLTHVPHCSLLASQGHVEGVGCFAAAEERVLTRFPDVHQIGMKVVIVIYVKMLL